jgi:hypothetical protein
MIISNGQETYKNAVILEREANGYDDSDFFALVWDEETQICKEVQTGTTRFAWNEYVTVDATDEVIEKARNYYQNEYEKAKQEIFEATLKAQKSMINMGDDVVVTKGRKAPKGVVGRVEKFRFNMYQPDNTQLSIQTVKGEWYDTYIKNVERVVDEEKIWVCINAHTMKLKTTIASEILYLKFNGLPLYKIV